MSASDTSPLVADGDSTTEKCSRQKKNILLGTLAIGTLVVISGVLLSRGLGGRGGPGATEQGGQTHAGNPSKSWCGTGWADAKKCGVDCSTNSTICPEGEKCNNGIGCPMNPIYECGTFQLLKGFDCCPHPDYNGQFDTWWLEHEYAEPVSESKLPLIVLDTDGVNPSCGDKVDANITVIYDAAGANSLAGNVIQTFSSDSTRTRIAGQSSRGYTKKQFNIYFKKDKSILDLPAQEKYRLNGPGIHQDASALTNWLMFTLDRCNGRWSPRTRYVRAYLTSEDANQVTRPQDMGLYSLQEKIERNSQKVDVSSAKCSASPDCGYIMEMDRDCSQGRDGACLEANSCVGGKLEIRYPKEPTGIQRNFMQSYLQRMCNASLTDALFDYIDAESFYNQFVYNQFSMNVDGYVSSEFFHKHQGGKIHAGPQWDFNGGFGRNYESKMILDMVGRDPNSPDFGWMRNGTDDNEWRKTIGSLGKTLGWKAFLKNQQFVNGLICHYKNLRAFNMTDDRLMEIIDAGNAFLKLEGAADNFLPDLETQVAKMKDFSKARAAWMDANIDDYAIGLSEPCPKYTPPSRDKLISNCQMPDVTKAYEFVPQ